MNLISALRNNVYNQTPGGAIFSEARSVLGLHFVHITFSAVPRDCNHCTHELVGTQIS